MALTQRLRPQCSVPLHLLTWSHSTWGQWVHPVGWFTGGLGEGVIDCWGLWRGMKEARPGFGKDATAGGISPRGLCPFRALKGRKWGAQLPRAASPLKPSVFQVGESKEQEDRGSCPRRGRLPPLTACGRGSGRRCSLIRIIFFQVGSRAWVCLSHAIEGSPCSVRISLFLLHCPVWIRTQTRPGWTCQGPVPRQKLVDLCCGE